MRYVYLDFKALRFRYKGGGVNCFWKDLLGFKIKWIGLCTISFDYTRFAIFLEGFFYGVKKLFTNGKVRKTVLRRNR